MTAKNFSFHNDDGDRNVAQHSNEIPLACNVTEQLGVLGRTLTSKTPDSQNFLYLPSAL